jgi:hypothetical protein
MIKECNYHIITIKNIIYFIYIFVQFITDMVIDIDWKDVLKKEARGSNDIDLGEVQEMINDKIIVQRGVIKREKFYLPQNLVESFDGSILRFHISSDQISKYSEDSAPASTDDQYASTTAIDTGGGSAGGIKMDEA